MNAFEGYLLIFAFVIALQYYRLAMYKKSKTQEYVLEKNFPRSVPQRSYFSFLIRSLCLVAAWVLLTIAVARLYEKPDAVQKGPQLQSKMLQGKEFLPKIDEVAFVLDVSSSMNAKDSSGGIARLIKAKEIISTMMEDLGGINASLIGFAGNTQTIVPGTLDYLYFRILLDAVGVNETAQAGTNLLAMVDAIKAKYVDSPYRKSVLVVLLTDGEDTGFLAMDDSAKKQAEIALLDLVSATVSDELRWEVVGLGSRAGAEVPGVMYESRPVISQMRQDLLQSMAQAARGHFYGEIDVPVTEICDDLLADIAGSNQAYAAGADRAVSSYAPATGNDILFLLAISGLLLFAAVTLPQYQKKVAV